MFLAESMISSLLKKPLTNGTPHSANVLTIQVPNVTGIFFQIPPMSFFISKL